jgi:hypothetical protein
MRLDLDEKAVAAAIVAALRRHRIEERGAPCALAADKSRHRQSVTRRPPRFRKLVDNTPPPGTIPAAVSCVIPFPSRNSSPPSLKLWPGYGYHRSSTYEIPEGYHGFLTTDYQTPGCPALRETGRSDAHPLQQGRIRVHEHWLP